jgi:trans-aconitate methyltransferase
MVRIVGDSTDATWQYYGEHDPYFGVISHEEYRRDKLTSNSMAQFFQTGDAEISQLFHLLEQHGFVPRPGSAIDFGCGVGRLLLPLAARFKQVIGVDVSPHMLTEAKRNLGSRDITNVQLNTSVPESGTVDFVHSLYVLQHVPTEVGLRAIFALWDRLAEGGVLAVQIPTFFHGSRAYGRLRKLRNTFPFLQVLLNSVAGRRLHQPGMQMNVYDLNALTFRLSERGAKSLAAFRHDSDKSSFAGVYLVARR